LTVDREQPSPTLEQILEKTGELQALEEHRIDLTSIGPGFLMQHDNKIGASIFAFNLKSAQVMLTACALPNGSKGRQLFRRCLTVVLRTYPGIPIFCLSQSPLVQFALCADQTRGEEIGLLRVEIDRFSHLLVDHPAVRALRPIPRGNTQYFCINQTLFNRHRWQEPMFVNPPAKPKGFGQ